MTIVGQDTHAGTTPMPRRHDALLGAARVVEAVNRTARQFPAAVGTVGVLEVKPGSPNVVPGEVFLTVDLRDPDAAVIDRMENEIAAQARSIGGELGLEVAIKTISAEPAVQFDAGCVAAVRAATAISGYTVRDMISRAGHDAAFVSRVTPAAMIFVPCKDGVSHNEAEYSSREQCAPARRCCCRPCSTTTGSWPSGRQITVTYSPLFAPRAPAAAAPSRRRSC